MYKYLLIKGLTTIVVNHPLGFTHKEHQLYYKDYKDS